MSVQGKAALLMALLLAGVHLYAGKLQFLSVIPRSRWLSFSGGVSVAYVFIHILPELRKHQDILAAAAPPVRFIEHHAYLLSLVGLSVFYGLERLAKLSKKRARERDGEDATEVSVYRIHIASFSLYNLLIGYLLLHREQPGTKSLLLYSFAMALHFIVNDVGLRQDHRQRYEARGRWMVSAAVVGGCLIGFMISVADAAVATLFAFLAGGTVMNVLKEELPEERESSFAAFVAGAAGYSVVLLTF